MYIVDLLRRLTEVGLVKWVGGGKEGLFVTSIGKFSLQVFDKKDLVEKKGFFGKEKAIMMDQWVLSIKDPSGSFEELSGEALSEMYYLWLTANISSRKQIFSVIQEKLFLEILRDFEIQP